MNRKMIDTEIERQGLLRSRLAVRIGVHPTTLNRFLTGKTMLGVEQLAELLKILNIKFEALMKKAS